MQNLDTAVHERASHVPWNKGKLLGAKPPLRTKHVWAIRTKLQVEGRTRDLAMFNLAIDSKLRGCDVVGLKVEDVAPHGITIDRATVRQRKTGHPVRFELTEQTREAIDNHIKATEARRVPVCKPPLRSVPDNTAIRAASVGLDRKYRIGPEIFRDALAASNQGNAHLSSHRQLTRGPIALGTHQNREHGALPRHRGRRCTRHSRAG